MGESYVFDTAMVDMRQAIAVDFATGNLTRFATGEFVMADGVRLEGALLDEARAALEAPHHPELDVVVWRGLQFARECLAQVVAWAMVDGRVLLVNLYGAARPPSPADEWCPLCGDVLVEAIDTKEHGRVCDNCYHDHDDMTPVGDGT